MGHRCARKLHLPHPPRREHPRSRPSPPTHLLTAAPGHAPSPANRAPGARAAADGCGPQHRMDVHDIARYIVQPLPYAGTGINSNAVVHRKTSSFSATNVRTAQLSLRARRCPRSHRRASDCLGVRAESSESLTMSAFAKPLLHGIPLQTDNLARISDVTLLPELAHVGSYDFARCPDVLRKQFVRESDAAYRTIRFGSAKAFGQRD